MKKRKTLVRILIITIIFCIAGFGIASLLKKRRPEFKFATIERGDIKNTITATGILHPKSKIEIGTQISGTVDNIFVDYNDQIEAGEKLAQIDRKILNALLDEARAAIFHTQEKLNFSRSEYKKKKELFETGYLSEIEFLKFQSNYFIDSSNNLSARANLQKAYANIEYSEIISPVSGTVIEKNVEVGQTVAANFNTPILFVVAEDLTKMEIHASVDESDISYVHEGQEIEFSVLAYPDSIFHGIVDQIRMHPRMIQNVVNYIVVINVNNKFGVLLPGMTATIDFIIEQKIDILKVSKSALNFIPDKRMAEDFHERMREKMEAVPDSMKPYMEAPGNTDVGSVGQEMQGPPPGIPDGGGLTGRQSPQQPPERGLRNRLSRSKHQPYQSPGRGQHLLVPPEFYRNGEGVPEGQMPTNIGQIWYIDEYGEIAMEPVMTGISDDSHIEIVRCRYLSEGMRIISGVIDRSKESKGKMINANQMFGGNQQMGEGTPPPPSGGPQ